MEIESQYQLEPEFLLVVLPSLVQNGNITLSLTGKKLDAANINEATKTPLDTTARVQARREAQGPCRWPNWSPSSSCWVWPKG